MNKRVAVFILLMLCVSFIVVQVVMPEILGFLAYRFSPRIKVGATYLPRAILDRDWGLIGASAMGGAAIGAGIGMFFGPVGFIVGMGLGAL